MASKICKARRKVWLRRSIFDKVSAFLYSFIILTSEAVRSLTNPVRSLWQKPDIASLRMAVSGDVDAKF